MSDTIEKTFEGLEIKDLKGEELERIKKEAYHDARAVIGYLAQRKNHGRSRGDMFKCSYLMKQLGGDYNRLVRAIGFLRNRYLLIVDKMWVADKQIFINMYRINPERIRAKDDKRSKSVYLIRKTRKF